MDKRLELDLSSISTKRGTSPAGISFLSRKVVFLLVNNDGEMGGSRYNLFINISSTFRASFG